MITLAPPCPLPAGQAAAVDFDVDGKHPDVGALPLEDDLVYGLVAAQVHIDPLGIAVLGRL